MDTISSHKKKVEKLVKSLSSTKKLCPLANLSTFPFFNYFDSKCRSGKTSTPIDHSVHLQAFSILLQIFTAIQWSCYTVLCCWKLLEAKRTEIILKRHFKTQRYWDFHFYHGLERWLKFIFFFYCFCLFNFRFFKNFSLMGISQMGKSQMTAFKSKTTSSSCPCLNQINCSLPSIRVSALIMTNEEVSWGQGWAPTVGRLSYSSSSF